MPSIPKPNSLLIRLCVEKAKWISLVFLILAAIMGWQARHFEINASAETLLTKGNVLYRQNLIVDRIFAPQEFVLIAYVPQESELFSEETYGALKSIADRVGKLERVQSIRYLLNVPLVSMTEGGLSGDFSPDELTLEKRPVDPATLSDLFRGHPIYEDLLVNKDQTATAMQVSFKRNPELEEIRNAIVEVYEGAVGRELLPSETERIEKLESNAEPMEKRLGQTRIAEIEAIGAIIEEYTHSAEIHFGGAHVLGYELIKIVKNDLIVFGAAIALMVALVLYALFRRLNWIVIPMICCAICVSITTGLFALLDLNATVISANYITLQLILTLAIVIHLIAQYRESHKIYPDASPKELAALTLELKAKPCFYAAMTTSVGFGSLMASGIQPVNTFGLMMIVAMLVSTVGSLLLFPALLVVMGGHKRQSDWRFISDFINAMSRISIKRGGFVILGAVLFCGLGFGGLSRVSVENSFIDDFRKSTKTHRDLHFVDQNFGGSTPLDLVFKMGQSEVGEKSLIFGADAIQTLQAAQAAIGEIEGVGKAMSIVNFAALAKMANRDKPITEYELTAIYYALDKDLRESLLGSYFSEDRNLARLSFRIKDATEGLNRAAVIKEIDEKATSVGMEKESFYLSNLFVLYQDLLQRLFKSQALTIGIVMGALLVCFLIVFKSFRISLVALAPNLVSTIGILGLMGWLGIALDFMTITIASVAMGIAVDDTIHYIHRFMEERKSTDGRQAVERAHQSVGMAIFYTTIVIVAGFSLLGLSDFVPSIHFGLLTAASISIALLADMLLLPAILLRVKTNP